MTLSEPGIVQLFELASASGRSHGPRLARISLRIKVAEAGAVEDSKYRLTAVATELFATLWL